MPNPVVHFEVSAKDGKRAQEFYGQLFGWHVDASNPMHYGLVDTHTGKGINGGIMQTNPGQPPMVTVYAEVDDLQEYLSKAERLGGKTLVPPTEVPGMVTFALFADPEGNAFGLVKSEPSASPRRQSARSRTSKAGSARPSARRRKQ
jgi:predicted enzyme related to lactoylglutathione lyase